MASVEVRPGESFDSAFRRFKRKVQTEAIIKEIKKHAVYLKQEVVCYISPMIMPRILLIERFSLVCEIIIKKIKMMGLLIGELKHNPGKYKKILKAQM